MAKYGDQNYGEANFIDHALIESVLEKTKDATDEVIDTIIEKALVEKRSQRPNGSSSIIIMKKLFQLICGKNAII